MISYVFAVRGKMLETSKTKYWLSRAWLTLHFEALLQLDDFLIVLVFQLLHEVAVFLDESK